MSSFITSIATILDAVAVVVLGLLIFLILPKIFIRPRFTKNLTTKRFTRLNDVFTFELDDNDKECFKSVDIEGDEKSNTLIFNVQEGINDVVLTLCIFDDYGKPIEKRLCHASIPEGQKSFEVDIKGDSRYVNWFINGINRGKFTSDKFTQSVSRTGLTLMGAIEGALFGVFFYFVSDLMYSIFYTIIGSGVFMTDAADPYAAIETYSKLGLYVSIGIGLFGIVMGIVTIRNKYAAYFTGGYEDD